MGRASKQKKLPLKFVCGLWEACGKASNSTAINSSRLVFATAIFMELLRAVSGEFSEQCVVL